MYYDAALFENSTPELDKSVLIESSSGIGNLNQAHGWMDGERVI